MRPNDSTDFWAKVTKTDTCWLWPATKGNSYGRFCFRGRHWLPNRFAWMLAYGSLPDGMLVCHTCDNPLCVRNDDEGWYEMNGVMRPRRGHLWIGTDADNSIDREIKGRGHAALDAMQAALSAHPECRARGMHNANARLTEESVRAMRESFTGRSGEVAAFARQYGTSKTTIVNALTGRTWAHVGAEDQV